MTVDPDDFLTSRYRKEYQEDTFKWLHGRFRWVNERIIKENDWQVSQAKEFAQNAGESIVRHVTRTHDSLILWLGFIAIVALGSAGLWIGVGGVAAILAWNWYRNLLARKMLWRLDRFRDDFRKLLAMAEGDGRWADGSKEMLEEDKAFLRKCRDSILFPLAVTPLRRETFHSHEVERIEILYREYCGLHVLGDECDLCVAKQRVQEHVEGVLSKFESQVGLALKHLVAEIDGRSSEAVIHAETILEEYREWEQWLSLRLPESVSKEKLLQALRDKGNWTFEEADQVRELCRTEIAQNRYSESGDRASQIFEALTTETEAAAKRCGLEKVWRFYNTNKNWFVEGSGSPFEIRMEYTIKNIRRALARKNPETTVRELVYADGNVRVGFDQLQPLKSYGFDLEMIERELRAAWKLVLKERKARREELQVLSAAWSHFRIEETEQERRTGAAPPR